MAARPTSNIKKTGPLRVTHITMDPMVEGAEATTRCGRHMVKNGQGHWRTYPEDRAIFSTRRTYLANCQKCRSWENKKRTGTST